MDVPFEEWVQHDAQYPCIKQWGEKLIRLGTSWDSFRRKEADIVEDLVEAGGIPLMAARDICKIAKGEIERGNAPMAIFWDLENMPIPASSSGRDVSTRLKTILAPYGNLVQFRGYASIGLNLIPQQKRSDLQLSGCHLVDCPHNGRKEVADKMIIVDAMQFAYKNPDGATLCFITGDVDYAYLLAVLQQPNWRTIVISKGTMSSMLHVNCEVRMRWETDILQLRPAAKKFSNQLVSSEKRKESTTVIERERPLLSHPAITGEQLATRKVEIEVVKENTFVPLTLERQSTHTTTDVVSKDSLPINHDDSPSTNGKHISRLVEEDTSFPLFEPLTPSEEWTDDVELLLSLLKANGGVGFKRTIANLLRTTNPARFPNRRASANFLSNAIEAGVVVEMGQGSYKELSVPSSKPPLKITGLLPPYLKRIVPEKVFKVAPRMPYVMFIEKKFISKGTILFEKMFVTRPAGSHFIILMFGSSSDVQRILSDELCNLSDNHYILVDWRNQKFGDDELVGTCCGCGQELLESQVIYKANKTNNGISEANEDAFCSKCYKWDSTVDRKRDVNRVISMMTMMAENDDIYVSRKHLKKMLYQRYNGLCTTHKHAELWIDEAVKDDKVAPFKKEGQKRIQLCLEKFVNIAHGEQPPDDLDTSEEEKHVVNFLKDRLLEKGWVSRKEVNESLEMAFPVMSSPLWRARVFEIGHSKKRFFTAKGPFGQCVDLTEQAAQDSLDQMAKATRQELEWELESSLPLRTEPDMSDIVVKDDDVLTSEATEKGRMASETLITNESIEIQDKNKFVTARENVITSLESSPVSPPISEVAGSDGAVEKNLGSACDTESGGTKETRAEDEGDNLNNEIMSDDIPEWDGESIDSAEIDARLHLSPATMKSREVNN